MIATRRSVGANANATTDAGPLSLSHATRNLLSMHALSSRAAC
jgi:hypothetical protein